MISKTLIILCSVGLLLIPPIFAGGPNPFFSGTRPPAEQKKETGRLSGSLQKSSQLEQAYRFLRGLQRSYNEKITSTISNYRDSKDSKLLFYVFLIAVGYGFFHAMMPGHGKGIILGWILSSHRKFYKVLLTASLGMVMHVFTAIIMVYSIWLLIGGRISSQSAELTRFFSFLAFGILCIIALKQLWGLFPKKEKRESACHHHELEDISDTTSIKACFITAATIGVIPCPVSTVLIVFMISQGFHIEGLLTGGFFALGMAGTLLIYSILIWSFRSILLKNKNHLLGRILDILLPIAGSLLLIFSGSIFILPYL